MKKILLTIIALACFVGANAQLTDTVRHRVKNYYYDEWIDTLPEYSHNSWLYNRGSGGYGGYKCFEKYVDRPLRIIGIAIMAERAWGNSEMPMPEDSVGIGVFNFRDSIMTTWATARWDTCTPRTMELVLTSEPSTYSGGFAVPYKHYCNLYEVYFGKEILVDSTYCLYGTNVTYDVDSNPPPRQVYQYVSVGTCYPHPPYHQKVFQYYSDSDRWHWCDTINGAIYDCNMTLDWGAFFPIVIPEYYLRATPNDSVMGIIHGLGLYEDSTMVTVHAVPNRGYRFVEWEDHDTSSFRQVLVTQDTMLYAYFEAVEEYTVSVNTESSLKGTVSGGGTYGYGQEAVKSAAGLHHFKFLRWNDGDTANPRSVTVVGDTSFTAYFTDWGYGSIDGTDDANLVISPNPTDGRVRIESDEVMRHVWVYDMAGKEVLHMNPRSTEAEIDLADSPKGTYIVKIKTRSGEYTRKLIVQ